MIKFKDYKIKATKEAGILKNPKFEPLQETLLRINSWIEKNEVMVLNVETVIMPHASNKRGYMSAPGADGANNRWYQLFRVWYQG